MAIVLSEYVRNRDRLAVFLVFYTLRPQVVIPIVQNCASRVRYLPLFRNKRGSFVIKTSGFHIFCLVKEPLLKTAFPRTTDIHMYAALHRVFL